MHARIYISGPPSVNAKNFLVVTDLALDSSLGQTAKIVISTRSGEILSYYVAGMQDLSQRSR